MRHDSKSNQMKYGRRLKGSMNRRMNTKRIEYDRRMNTKQVKHRKLKVYLERKHDRRTNEVYPFIFIFQN